MKLMAAGMVGMMVMLAGGCANMGADSPRAFTGYWRSVELNGPTFDKLEGIKLDLGENGKGTMVFLLSRGEDEVHAVKWQRVAANSGSSEAAGTLVCDDDKGGSYALRVSGGMMVLSSKNAFARLKRPEE